MMTGYLKAAVRFISAAYVPVLLFEGTMKIRYVTTHRRNIVIDGGVPRHSLAFNYLGGDTHACCLFEVSYSNDKWKLW